MGGWPPRFRQRNPRRQEHDPIEPSIARTRGPQQNRRTHGMRQRKVRGRTIRQHHLAHERFEVDLVLIEASNVALTWVA